MKTLILTIALLASSQAQANRLFPNTAVFVNDAEYPQIMAMAEITKPNPGVGKYWLSVVNPKVSCERGWGDIGVVDANDHKSAVAVFNTQGSEELDERAKQICDLYNSGKYRMDPRK